MPIILREQLTVGAVCVAALGLLVLGAFLWFLVTRAPDTILTSAQQRFHTSLSLKDYLEAVNAQRATMIQILTLFGSAFSGIFGAVGLYIALGNWRLAQNGQITDRFTKAIDQLGSSTLTVRLGAIHALEQVARDSEENHWPVMGVLTAFVREHAPRVAAAPQDLQDACGDIHERPVPRADIQAIFDVLARRRWDREDEHQRLDLSRCDLSGIRIYKAGDTVFRQIILRESLLADVSWQGIDLGGADFAHCRLERANLSHAFLQEASFEGAELIGVDFDGAFLTDAVFAYADLCDVSAISATMECISFFRARIHGDGDWGHVKASHANFRHAYLSGAHLYGSTLDWAKFDHATLENVDLRNASLKGVQLPPLGQGELDLPG